MHTLSYIISPVTRKQAKQGGEIPSPRRDSDFASQNQEVITGTVIYADVLFGINFVANLCVLLITDWIFKFSARISRMIISATLGAAWAVICVCIPLRFALLEKFITYGPVTLIMAMIMLSGNKNFKQKTSKQLKLYMRNLLKAGAGMILTALFAGGIMHWLKYTFAGYFIENVILSDSELVIFLTVTVIVVVIVLKTLKTIRITDGLKRHIVIGVAEREFEMDAIIDTGNSLVDYVGKRPVTVVERTYFSDILSDIDNLQKLGYHLIPYNSVGNSGGMMEIITADYIHIYEGENVVTRKHAAIGMSPRQINKNGDYHALLGKDMVS